MGLCPRPPGAIMKVYQHLAVWDFPKRRVCARACASVHVCAHLCICVHLLSLQKFRFPVSLFIVISAISMLAP